MQKLLLTTAAATVLLLAGTADAQAPKRTAPFQVPFAVAMVLNQPEIVVATNGPLQLIARCYTPTGSPRSRLFIRSSVDGWHLTQAIDPTRTNLVNLLAGEEPIGGVSTLDPTIEPGAVGTALAPTGEILAVAGDTSIRGMHLLPGVDCVMAGVATVLKVPTTP
jgi:hypothetical protein